MQSKLMYNRKPTVLIQVETNCVIIGVVNGLRQLLCRGFKQELWENTTLEKLENSFSSAAA